LKSVERVYKDGKREGELSNWHENGQIELEANFIDDIIEGKVTWWYENGQKWKEEYYNKNDNDELHGKFIEWDVNGNIKREAIYKDGACISGDC